MLVSASWDCPSASKSSGIWTLNLRDAERGVKSVGARCVANDGGIEFEGRSNEGVLGTLSRLDFATRRSEGTKRFSGMMDCS